MSPVVGARDLLSSCFKLFQLSSGSVSRVFFLWMYTSSCWMYTFIWIYYIYMYIFVFFFFLSFTSFHLQVFVWFLNHSNVQLQHLLISNWLNLDSGFQPTLGSSASVSGSCQSGQTLQLAHLLLDSLTHTAGQAYASLNKSIKITHVFKWAHKQMSQPICEIKLEKTNKQAKAS